MYLNDAHDEQEQTHSLRSSQNGITAPAVPDAASSQVPTQPTNDFFPITKLRQVVR